MSSEIKAVIFDMGGVLVKYPDPGLFDRIFKMTETDDEMFKILEDFELGRASVEALTDLIKAIKDEDLKKEMAKSQKALSDMRKDVQKCDKMINLLKVLKDKGYKLGLLTNNGWSNSEKTESMILVDKEPFDVIVESCKVGMRKPHIDIFIHTVEALGLKPEECVFLDDLNTNCDGARKAGLHAIQVVLGNSGDAIEQLEKLLKTELK